MTRLRWLLVVALALAGSIGALSEAVSAQTPPPPTGLMAEANVRYERGDYAEAAQQYEGLIALGYQDASVHYNLGNAYLEIGDLGRAVLNYLRAEELSPRDPDVLANLNLARSRTVDQLEAEGDSLVASVANFGRQWATPVEFGLAAILLWAVGGLAVAGLILRPATRRRAALRTGAVIALGGMLIPLVLLLSMLYSNPYDKTGVITAGTVVAVSGPGPQFGEEFTLHSGAQVRLTGFRHGWLRVALPGGELQGWLPAHAIEGVGRKHGSGS